MSDYTDLVYFGSTSDETCYPFEIPSKRLMFLSVFRWLPFVILDVECGDVVYLRAFGSWFVVGEGNSPHVLLGPINHFFAFFIGCSLVR